MTDREALAISRLRAQVVERTRLLAAARARVRELEAELAERGES